MAEDSCGNTTTCTQSITINDTTAPVMTSPVTLTAYCSINEVPAYMTLQEFIIGGGSAMDNCELDTASFTLLSETSTPGNCPKIYTRTYQIADLCGNTATAAQMIWVNDSIAPQITCPAAVTVACITDVPAPDITLVVATDNCGTPCYHLDQRCMGWQLSAHHHKDLPGRRLLRQYNHLHPDHHRQ